MEKMKGRLVTCKVDKTQACESSEWSFEELVEILKTKPDSYAMIHFGFGSYNGYEINDVKYMASALTIGKEFGGIPELIDGKIIAPVFFKRFMLDEKIRSEGDYEDLVPVKAKILSPIEKIFISIVVNEETA